MEAGVDIKVVSERMGHSTTTITQNLHQHVRRVVHARAAEAIVQLLPERKRSEARRNEWVIEGGQDPCVLGRTTGSRRLASSGYVAGGGACALYALLPMD